jgi:hypothetical protein
MPDDDVTVNIDSTGERLHEELRLLTARVDAVPDDVVHAAKGAFAWRTIDADLAELAYDSLLDREGTLVRSGDDDGSRFLTFEGPEVTVEMEVATAGDRRRLTGQLVPGHRASVEVRHAGGVLTVEADELGRFRCEVQPGPMSLRCRVEADGRPVVETDWVTV